MYDNFTDSWRNLSSGRVFVWIGFGRAREIVLMPFQVDSYHFLFLS